MQNILLIDFEDSFTLNLVDLLAIYSVNIELIKHHEIVSIDLLNSFDAIILSPGPNSPPQYPIINQIIEKYHQHIPMLGICLGHQALGIYFGYELRRSLYPKHGIVDKIYYTEDPIFTNIPQPTFEAMRYNSLTLDSNSTIQSNYSIICTSENGEIMGCKHLFYPIYSFQFHPESIGSPFGHQLISNWIEFITHIKLVKLLK